MEVFKRAVLNIKFGPFYVFSKVFSPLPDTTTPWMRLWFSGSMKVVSEGDYCILFAESLLDFWSFSSLVTSYSAWFNPTSLTWNDNCNNFNSCRPRLSNWTFYFIKKREINIEREHSKGGGGGRNAQILYYNTIRFFFRCTLTLTKSLFPATQYIPSTQHMSI